MVQHGHLGLHRARVWLSSGIQPRAAGTAFVRATSEGKTGQAKVVVH